MNEQIEATATKVMAGATVIGGGYMSYEVAMNGLNMLALIMGIVVSFLAACWWLIKIAKELKKK